MDKGVRMRVRKKVNDKGAFCNDIDNARDKLDEFLNYKIVSCRGKRGKSKVEKSFLEAKKRAEVGDWVGSTGKVFVGLYSLCYSLVYGNIPLELFKNGDFNIVSRMANKALHEYFYDDVDEFVEFIKWSWEREKFRDAKALREGYTRGRMVARYQFSLNYIEDYRVYLSSELRRARYK
jgi:hypothetical protein